MGFHLKHATGRERPVLPEKGDVLADRINATSFLYLMKLIRESSFHNSDDLMRVYCSEYRITPINLKELRTIYLKDVQQFYDDCVATKLAQVISTCRAVSYSKKDGIVLDRMFGEKVLDFYSKHINPVVGRGRQVFNRSLALVDIKGILVAYQMKTGTQFSNAADVLFNTADHEIYKSNDQYYRDPKNTIVLPWSRLDQFLSNMTEFLELIRSLGNGHSANRQDTELITHVLEVLIRICMLDINVSQAAPDQLFNLDKLGDEIDSKAAAVSLIDETAAVCIFDDKDYNFGQQTQNRETLVYKYLASLFKYKALTTGSNSAEEGEFNSLGGKSE